MTLRGQESTATKLLKITKVATGDTSYRFTSLASLINEESLERSFHELNKRRATGIDGVSLEEYGQSLKENIHNLYERMKKFSYRPQPVRRVGIPKANGKTRMLGIPTVEDKIVQRAIAQILEAIYEPAFLEMSYGFRPNRSCHDALEKLNKAIVAQPTNYIIDADIKGFFDNVKHEWIIKFLEHRIADRNFIRLIVRFLKSGIMEEGKYYATEIGTPQGGIISPILSNIYLHYVLDLWVEKSVKKKCKGYVEAIRYADDFVICVKYKEEAENIVKMLRERLNKFGLELSEEKTRVIRFGRFAKEKQKRPPTFDFLGITHYCDISRNGKFKVGRQTSRKKLISKIKEMNVWLKKVRNLVPIADIWTTLKQKLRGHYQYYGISGNYRKIASYYYYVIKLTFKWLNRRSQRKSYTWQGFTKYLLKYPLPLPKIYHSYVKRTQLCEYD
jgi:group II intron reverse transcriptase/maturase